MPTTCSPSPLVKPTIPRSVYHTCMRSASFMSLLLRLWAKQQTQIFHLHLFSAGGGDRGRTAQQNGLISLTAVSAPHVNMKLTVHKIMMAGKKKIQILATLATEKDLTGKHGKDKEKRLCFGDLWCKGHRNLSFFCAQ